MVASHRCIRLLLVFAVLLTLALTGGAAQAGSPVQDPSGSTSSLASLLDADGRLELPPGFSGSINAEGWQLMSGENEPPRFAPLETAESLTPLDPRQERGASSTGAAAPLVAGDEKWLPGFNLRGAFGYVYALAAGDGNDVYIGGFFLTIGDVRAPSGTTFVAKWDGSHWSALGYGFDNPVLALAWDATNKILYAGGQFDYICGAADCTTTRVNHIARWSGGAWSALSYGLTNYVDALALDGSNNLYAGGQFAGYCTTNATCPGSTTVNNIAKWNRAAGTWSALTHDGIGVNAAVRALAWRDIDSKLIIGGDFSLWGGVPGEVRDHLATWNGTADDRLCYGTSGNVYALAWDSTHQVLFVGGDFDSLYGGAGLPTDNCGLATNTQVNHIAKYNYNAVTPSWGPLHFGVNGIVRSIVVDAANHKAYAGGDFTNLCGSATCASPSPASRVAQWDYAGAGVWSTLGSGIDLVVYALALQGGLYAGGGFLHAGDQVAFSIAKWNSPNWSAVGGGNGVFGDVISTVAADGKGNVYIGGYFQFAGGVRVNNIAKWNGSTWSALDKGLNPIVRAIAVDKDGSVYAGGDFIYTCGNSECSTNGDRVNRVAKWNGTAWSPVGNGFSSPPLAASLVFALTFDRQGNLIAGGIIPAICNNIDCSAPPTVAHNLVKWTHASGKWAPLGGGTLGPIFGLAVDSADKLYVAGDFAAVCGDADCAGAPVQVNRIAKWNGTAWERLAFGVNGIVAALAVDHTDKLYVGGDMAKACGDLACGTTLEPLNRIGKWTPSGASGTWEKLSFGVNAHVYSLAVDDANNLFAGGVFPNVCANDACAPGAAVNSIAKWNGSAWSPLGSGIRPNGILVQGLAWQFGRLSVGGAFYGAGDKVATRFAQYQDNNPPTLANIAKTGYPGATITFTAADFAGAMTDTESEALAKIQVLSLPAHGTLNLSGTAVTANQEIAAASLANLTFTPTAGWAGATSFSWNGHDGNSYAMTPANVNITIAYRSLYLPLVRR